ncbi:MAG: hypothetical protein NTY05_15910 [Rhodocyclales bacterium]|nr:hypothetical protein [Rhodocyclales bacterium]
MPASLRHRLHETFVRWALRVRPPEPAPIVLTQRRVYVLPTRAGLAYATALGVILLGAMNYNLSLGHALVFLLAGLGIVAILHTFRNLVLVAIRPGRCEPVFAGSLAQFDLVLENRRSDARTCLPARWPRWMSTPKNAAGCPCRASPSRPPGRWVWCVPGAMPFPTSTA